MIERARKLGLGTAYVEGLNWALAGDFEYVVTMDCDFSHDPREIPALVEAAGEADVVVGSRYIGGIRIINWPLRRLVISYFASFYIRMITRLPVRDPTGGFNCFRRSAIQSIDPDRCFSAGYAFLVELKYRAWRKKLKIREIPIIFHERRGGQSKMGRDVILESIFSVIRLRAKKILGLL